MSEVDSPTPERRTIVAVITVTATVSASWPDAYGDISLTEALEYERSYDTATLIEMASMAENVSATVKVTDVPEVTS